MTDGATPRFTVVLSAYNEEGFVADAIGSVLAQTCEDFELIVVDDGSRDGTAEIVEGFASDGRLRLIRQENRGLAPSLNRAARAGSAPLIALIDADDLWFPTFLEATGDALTAEPEAGFAYTDAWWYQASSGRFFRRSISEHLGAPVTAPTDPLEMLRSLLQANWLFGLTVIRRAAFEQMGGFNEHLAASEDYELWLRLLAGGFAAARAPGRLAIQRDRGGSMSKDRGAMLKSLREVYRVVAEDLEVPDDISALARGRIERVEGEARAAEGAFGATAARWLVRGWLGAARKAVAPGLVWHRETPAEVLAAFPARDW